MDYLERLLQRRIDKGDGNSAAAQSLRDQIASRKRGQRHRKCILLEWPNKKPSK
jgi:hypothetical protein